MAQVLGLPLYAQHLPPQEEGPWELLGHDVLPGMLVGGVRAGGRAGLVDKSSGIPSLSGTEEWKLPLPAQFHMQPRCHLYPTVLTTVPEIPSPAVNLLGGVSIINTNGLEMDTSQAVYQLS